MPARGCAPIGSRLLRRVEAILVEIRVSMQAPRGYSKRGTVQVLVVSKIRRFLRPHVVARVFEESGLSDAAAVIMICVGTTTR